MAAKGPLMSQIGYVIVEASGQADAMMADVAQRLAAKGLSVAGAVQVTFPTPPGHRTGMSLRILSDGAILPISLETGGASTGCRLDPDGFERGVAHVDASLSDDTDLLIVNKFGQREAEGRGFVPVIARAIETGVPVMTSVSLSKLATFRSFAETLAIEIPRTGLDMLNWCLHQTRHRSEDRLA